MKNNGFTLCANKYIDHLKSEGRYPTAHVYKNALRSFTEFCGTRTIAFRQVNRENLKRYSQFLQRKNKKLNTVSTYMRMLRCIYNHGVYANQAPYVHRLFHDVFTGVDTHHKKALPTSELHTLLYKDPKSEKLRCTQIIASLMFQFCGMSFADIAHLEKKNLKEGILKYHRIKTGTPMSVEVLDTARGMIRDLLKKDGSRSGCPDYLFCILSGKNQKLDARGYVEYQSALRSFNNHLKSLAKAFCLKSPVTSYSLRHSWATTAKRRGVPIEMISESLGHKSIKTTQIYLKGFELEERTKVNMMNYSYVEKFKFDSGYFAK